MAVTKRVVDHNFLNVNFLNVNSLNDKIVTKTEHLLGFLFWRSAVPADI